MADPSFLLKLLSSIPYFCIICNFHLGYALHFFQFRERRKHPLNAIIVKLYFYLKIPAAIGNLQNGSLTEFDMGYPVTHRIVQTVCLHNLKLAGKAINKVLIRPKETFSFYWLVRNADKKEPYKDGLNLVDGKIIGSYGGGLCQLSNLLFWCFLHTPLTIVERHGHAVESFPSTTEDLPKGTDATVSEGWCDLQVRNDTDNTFQIEVAFDESNIYGRIYTAEPVTKEYSIYNSSVTYVRQNGKIFQMAEVCRTETDTISGKTMKHLLYTNKCEITYLLPEGMEVQEK